MDEEPGASGGPPWLGTPVAIVLLSSFFATHPSVGIVMTGCAPAASDCAMKVSTALPDRLPLLLRNSQSRPAFHACPLSQLNVLDEFPPHRFAVAPSDFTYAGSPNATP